ncbi:hypothetical protein bhn_IV002 (plasmid) [Butyrivibrio hungatei]|uniref:Uncharacterized protein n=2 Tax=Butyrivibrio hungatei TaxID=185008 RepID=A0A1D9P5T9_9FIRM|nr:hypothetical protein bhn_IV002 [Butyrivibrio hungatei]
MNIAQIEYADWLIFGAIEKLGLEYAPDQVLSANKVMIKCLYISDKAELQQDNTILGRFKRWKERNEPTNLFEEVNQNQDCTQLAEDICNDLMRFYEMTPRIYYVWLLRNWGIFDNAIVEKAKRWKANDCNYQDDIEPSWYEKY